MKLILFNAPPKTGKDETTEFICSKFNNAVHFEFKKKLFELTKLIYSVTDEQWDSLYTRENKELPSNLLRGKSPREALIYVSETIIKPTMGYSYFGDAAADMVQNTGAYLSVFSDSGFVQELLPMMNRFGVENILIIRIHMDGVDFTGDSRKYLPDSLVSDYGFNIIDIENVYGKFDEFKQNVLQVVTEFLGNTE